MNPITIAQALASEGAFYDVNPAAECRLEWLGATPAEVDAALARGDARKLGFRTQYGCIPRETEIPGWRLRRICSGGLGNGGHLVAIPACARTRALVVRAMAERGAPEWLAPALVAAPEWLVEHLLASPDTARNPALCAPEKFRPDTRLWAERNGLAGMFAAAPSCPQFWSAVARLEAWQLSPAGQLHLA